MHFLGMSHKTYFRNTILKPMLEKGLLELTIPDKPKSPHQKYRATGNSKEFQLAAKLRKCMMMKPC
jgi:hypothetical protein